MSTDENLFLAKFLVKAKPLGPTHFGCRIALWGYVSRRFRLRDKSVGKVVRFYQKDVGTDIVVELDMPSPMTADVPHAFACGLGVRQFVDSDAIVDACSWAYKSEDIFFVIEPITARVQDDSRFG